MGKLVYPIESESHPQGKVKWMRPLVQEGIYTLAYYGYYTYHYYGKSPKLALRLKIMDPGEYFETPVERIYNVKRLIGKPKEGGDYEVGSSSRLPFEYCKLCPGRINRLDRIPLSYLKQDLYLGRIETVTRNYEKQEIPPPLTYSVVRELIGPAP